MQNITILVCLYNKSIDESNTIQSLLKGLGFNLENTKNFYLGQ